MGRSAPVHPLWRMVGTPVAGVTGAVARRNGRRTWEVPMSMQRALQVILVLALAGVAFSGALTVREFTTQAPGCSAIGAPGTILGYPPCLYGLVMYAATAVVAILGLRAKR